MASVIQLKDGKTVTIFDERDALELIGEHMGWELQPLAGGLAWRER